MVTDLLPVAKYFWDSDITSLSWERNKNFIIRRILEHGDYDSLHWLRAQLGDAGLRAWIIARNGKGLTPRQVRYWALILDIESHLADQWVKTASETLWELRR